MAGNERRSSPRVNDEKLTLKVNVGDFDSVTHTLNISTSGVYCKVDKEIPLMSRVRLALMMPDSQNPIEVTGIVVREHPVVIEGKVKHYDAAIFFEDLSARDKELISGYIARQAP